MIVLAVMTYNGGASEPVEASFDELGGTIGRADLAEVAIVSAVHRDARRRVLVVTGTQAPANGTWVRELRRMPRR